jgi:hypothetical protein
MNHTERGSTFRDEIARWFAGQGIQLQPEYSLPIGLRDNHKKHHRFDLGNSSLLVECKKYDWTEGNNNPSAKISTINEAMLHFLAAPGSYSKRLFLSKTSKKGVCNPMTLTEYYLQHNGHLVPSDVEVWEFDETTHSAAKVR